MRRRSRFAYARAVPPAAELSFSVVERPDELDALQAEWDALVEALPRPSPFLLHGWLRAWWRHFGEGCRFEAHVARRAGRLVGALPLQVRRLRGLWIAEFSGGAHAQLGDVLLAPGEGADVADALLERIRGVDLVDLSGIPASTQATLRLVERVEAPVVDLSPGWNAVYMSRLSSKRRSQHRKRLGALELAGHSEIRISATPEALDQALRLHALRWHGRPDRSTYALPGAATFHHDVLRELTPRARIALLELDGRAIAFRYGIRVGDSLVGNGIGFDPAFARFSPGWVLLLAALDHAAAEDVRRVELLGGDEAYKLQLADPAPLHDGLLPRTALGRLVAVTRLAAIVARRRLKQSETLRRAYNAPRRRAPAKA